MIYTNIVGEIEDLTEAYTVVADGQDDVEILINSPGGAAIEAVQLVNAIENTEKQISARVDVMAMSAAAVIALGCDKLYVKSRAMFMLHNCWGVTVGNANDHEQQAEAMHVVDNALQDIITKHCKDDVAELIRTKMNDGEYWLTGEQVAEMFDNAEVYEAPEKQEKLAAAGSLADLVDKLSNLQQEIAELKASAMVLEKPAEEEKPEEETEDPKAEETAEEETEAPAEEEEAPAQPKKKDSYSPEIMAIINEVL